MIYPFYFLPTRVVNEYKDRIGGGDKLTTPVIKRRISAIIYATMDKRVQISENLFKHRFGKVEIFVEENTKVVSKINYTLPIKVDNKIGRTYSIICTIYYKLNRSRKEFRKDTEKVV